MFEQLALRIQHFVDAASIKKRLLAAGVVRIAFGALTSIFYALHFSQRHFLWGADGVVSWRDENLLLQATHSWSLYAAFHTQQWADMLYAAGVLVSLAFMLGLGGRVTSVLYFVFTWSVYQRNFYTLDGGDNLLIILSFYLMFADVSALSLDATLFGRKPSSAWFSSLLHNAAITACLLQLAVLYFISDFYKIQGHVWSNGTALYYILRTNEFSLPGWSELVFRSPAVVSIGTYFTIVFEAMYPWCIWHSRLKYLMFACVLALHGGIAVLMGLTWFSLTMIAVDALFFDDPEFLRARDFFARQCARISLALRFTANAAPERALSQDGVAQKG